MTDKFENVKVVESRVIYQKHGRSIIEDVLQFADSSIQSGFTLRLQALLWPSLHSLKTAE